MIPAIGTVELERIASLGWQGTSDQQLGEWLLRAGSGFTSRANSVLPLGSPGCSLDEAFLVIDDFYRRHDLTPMFQVPHAPETDSLDSDLADRGWTLFNASQVLVADLNTALAACATHDTLPPAEFAERASGRWIGRHASTDPLISPSSKQVLVPVWHAAPV